MDVFGRDDRETDARGESCGERKRQKKRKRAARVVDQEASWTSERGEVFRAIAEARIT
jgi:hypothetical protein